MSLYELNYLRSRDRSDVRGVNEYGDETLDQA